MTMNNVSIKDFHVGKPAWSIERNDCLPDQLQNSI